MIHAIRDENVSADDKTVSSHHLIFYSLKAVVNICLLYTSDAADE